MVSINNVINPTSNCITSLYFKFSIC